MKKNEPLVSVICTNYNKGEWITEALESFLKQKTDFEFEILVVDDKSTDKSPKLIKEYAQKYPARIKAHYNQENLGITKTWIEICKQAKGKYIARCDGDDYWIDENKLQMQVDALEKNKGSKWSCTDYNIITPAGETVHTNANAKGINKVPESYVEMLVSRGMTMASTWLVDTKLMLEINKDLNETAVDDTFNIQLDLFNKTKLLYIPKSTTVYRIFTGSDSRPADQERVKLRDERLLNTQIEYIDKYENKQYKEIIIELLRQNTKDVAMHRAADERLDLIEKFRQDQKEKEDLISALSTENACKDKMINELKNSKRYKIGSALITPVSVIKSILNKKVR